MKHIKTLKGLLLSLLLVCVGNVSAHDFEENGIYYNILSESDKTVEVSGCSNECIGNVIVPEEVTCNGVIYSVVSIGNSAFSGRSNITGVQISNSVTKIDTYAFRNCPKLISAAISDYVTSIGDYAFTNCSSLVSVTIGNSVANIGTGAFSGCSAITSIEIPNSVIGIADRAFEDCSALINVKLGNGLTSIGKWAFQDCSALTSIEIPNTVTSLGNNAFSNCTSLGFVAIGNGVKSIGDYAFFRCTSLATLIIGDGVTSIGDYAFSNCSSIANITIGYSVTHIGLRAFYGCSKLTGIEIPNSVTNIGIDAFGGTSWFKNQTNGTVYVGKVLYTYNGTMPENTSITIKEGTLGIGEYAFNACSGLVSIKIPNSVTNIGKYAFQGCTNLSTIEIPNSVTSVGVGAFNNTQWYKAQEEGVIYVGKVLYKYKGNMPDGTNISINTGIASITAEAFSGYSSLASITIPNSVLNIGCYAFKGCAGLTTITIPCSVVSLGGYAFSGCTALRELIIEDSEKPLCCQMSEMKYYYPTKDYDYFFEDSPIEYMYIGRDLNNYAFSYSYGQWRKSLNSVVFGNGVTIIPSGIFDSCSKLSSVTMSSNIKSIGSYAFYACSKLADIALPCGLLSIGRAAFHSSGIISLTIPRSLASIEENVFNSTKQLKSIVVESDNSVYDSRTDCNAIIETSTSTLIRGCENTIIPNDVLKIDKYAFYGCTGLGSIAIPNSVTSIGDYAFYSCTSLRNINFSSNPKCGTNIIPSAAKCHLILDDSNATDFDITNANTYADVSYSRNIVEGKFGTIILPFTPNAKSLENYAFYALAESGDGYMRFGEVATPVANTPYIYTLREGKENVAITGGETTISSTVETPVVDGWQTIGSFTNQALDTSDGNYYAFSPSKNEINKITKNLTVLPYRAYFKSDNASKSALNIYISGTTGVEEISSSEIDGFENGAIFDLSGRKVAEPRKGNIYIKNGKKIMF